MSTMTAENENEPAPRLMLDRYEVLAEIARGGMGTVLLARLEGAGGFERLMAIKLMHEHLAEEAHFVTMLLDEARTSSNIRHPNAVGIVDVGSSDVGYYLVMDYVKGFPLSEVLYRLRDDHERRIPVGMRLLVDACHGLHAAHTATNAAGEPLDIVHRDVSPQNILVGIDGSSRIVDFGIALAASRITASRPGAVKGKPAYMSPEQAKGKTCDARSDVFSMGAIAWEVLTGQRLFASDSDVSTLVKVIQGEVERPSLIVEGLPDALEEVVLRALKPRLEDRTPSAEHLGHQLEQAARESSHLPSKADVASILASIFETEIEEKNNAIRTRLSASRGKEIQLDRMTLPWVPKLMKSAQVIVGSSSSGSGVRQGSSDISYDDTRLPPSRPDITPLPQEPSQPNARVPVDAERPPSGEHPAYSSTELHHSIPPATAREGTTTQPHSPRAIQALIAVIVVLVATVAYLATRGEAPTNASQSPETLASPDNARGINAPQPNPPSPPAIMPVQTTENEPPTETDVPTGNAPSMEESSAPQNQAEQAISDEDQVSSETTETPDVRPREHRRQRRRATSRTKRTPSTPAATRPAAAPPTQPVMEDNPYL